MVSWPESNRNDLEYNEKIMAGEKNQIKYYFKIINWRNYNKYLEWNSIKNNNKYDWTFKKGYDLNY